MRALSVGRAGLVTTMTDDRADAPLDQVKMAGLAIEREVTALRDLDAARADLATAVEDAKTAWTENERIRGERLKYAADLATARTQLAEMRDLLDKSNQDRAAVMDDAATRLERIAEAHGKEVDEHGGVSGYCGECEHAWPCATYRWATAPIVTGDCTWDLDDCEFDHDHNAPLAAVPDSKEAGE
jgi:hypothetical protein